MPRTFIPKTMMIPAKIQEREFVEFINEYFTANTNTYLPAKLGKFLKRSALDLNDSRKAP